MSHPLSPAKIHPPFAHYNHGIEVPSGQRLVFCSGQLGVDAEGTVPPDCAAQTELCFTNIGAILEEAGFGFEHLVRVNAYVAAREHLTAYMEVRDRLLAPPYPASTLMIVGGFARPEFLVEVEAIAAGP